MRSLRICSRCGQGYSPEAFGQDVTRDDGLRPWCRSCVSGYHKSLGKFARITGQKPPARYVPVWQRDVSDDDLEAAAFLDGE